MKDPQNFVSYALSGLCVGLTAVQTSEVFQIVSLICTILASCAALAFTVWKWYVSAKSDGKITADEISQLADDVKKGTDEIIAKTDEAADKTKGEK